MSKLADRLRRADAHEADLGLMEEAAERIEELERTLSLIAFCDTDGHPDEEPHGLYRSHMIQIAKRRLGQEVS